MGLVGGSIGLAAKARRLCGHVVGCARTERTLKQAHDRGAIDSATHDPREAAADAEIVILAAPIEGIVSLGKAIADVVAQDALVTDVGSVKGIIVRELTPALGVRFVGGHPMAGGERLGVQHARDDLFEGAAYFLTPTSETSADQLGRAEEFVRALGARVITCSPNEHDCLVAAVSHLPHVVAAALVGAVSDAAGLPVKAVLQAAGPGFRDTTRIAASDPELWVQICMSNREALLRALAAFGKRQAAFADALAAGNREGLRQLFEQAKKLRDGLA